MKKTIATVVTVAMAFASVWAEKVEGYVYDKDNNEPMIGVTVSTTVKGKLVGTATDLDGKYSIDLPEGSANLNFSYMGYESQNMPIIVDRQKGFKGNVYMTTQATALDAVVVSAGRYEQKLSDLTVSMNVLKAADVTKNSPSDIKATLNNTSGVDVTDKQPSIRGGSGWTYGVGSRCLIMVDGMSILSPAGGEINWNAIPMENISQVEVMKGASSVLYGSSALNGLINVRTARPSIDPTTRVNMYMSVYGQPDNDSYLWYDKRFWKDGSYKVEPLLRKTLFSGIRNPMSDGIDISHERRIGNFDVTGAVNLFTDEGYKKDGYNKRVRAAGSVTYYSPKIKGLNFGANVNFLSSEAADAFLWRSDKAPYEQSPLANMARQSNEFYIDPQFTYHDYDRNEMHKIKGRFYTSASNISTSSEGKNISEIIENMGPDYEAIKNDATTISDLVNKKLAEDPNAFNFKDMLNEDGSIKNLAPVNNLLSMLGEVYPDFPNITKYAMYTYLGIPTTSADLAAAVNTLKGIGNKYFPNATSSDYVDLIAWAMSMGKLPTSINDIVPIALNELLNNGKKEQALLRDPDRVDDYYLDYQFSKQFKSQNTLTVGATYEHVYSLTETSGTHNSDNIAAYVQYDDKFFDRLNLSVGARFEYYRVDQAYREANTKIFGLEIPVKPVFRGGLSYQAAKGTFIRASYGQGYRYPSITEKFIRKDIGGIGAYPNKDLKAESGYNVELGLKQGYKFGPVKGFVDVAAFYTEYKDMIEFRIGLFGNDAPYTYIDNLKQVFTLLQNGSSLGIGAQFYNVNRARIYGAELNVNGIVDITRKTQLLFNVGYVYTEPIDVNYKDVNNEEAGYTDLLQMKQKSNTSKYLKYRQKHTLKASLDLNFDRYFIGTSMTYKSKTLAVDYFMIDEREKDGNDAMDYIRSLLFGDLQGYWKDKNTGYFVQDIRAGVQITKGLKVMGIISNVWNKEYSTRPMDVSQPRTYTVQVEAKF